MPVIVPYVAAFLEGLGITSEVVATVIAEVIVDVAISFALGKIAQALAGNAVNGNTGPPAQTETVQGTLEPRRMVYGQVMTNGVIVFFGTHGSDSTSEWEVV